MNAIEYAPPQGADLDVADEFGVQYMCEDVALNERQNTFFHLNTQQASMLCLHLKVFIHDSDNTDPGVYEVNVVVEADERQHHHRGRRPPHQLPREGACACKQTQTKGKV